MKPTAPSWSFREFHEGAYAAAYEGLDPKYAASLYSGFQHEIQWRAEMAAQAALEATRWFRFRTRISAAFAVAGDLLVIGVVFVASVLAIYYIVGSAHSPFQWAVVVVLAAVLAAVSSQIF